MGNKTWRGKAVREEPQSGASHFHFLSIFFLFSSFCIVQSFISFYLFIVFFVSLFLLYLFPSESVSTFFSFLLLLERKVFSTNIFLSLVLMVCYYYYYTYIYFSLRNTFNVSLVLFFLIISNVSAFSNQNVQ